MMAHGFAETNPFSVEVGIGSIASRPPAFWSKRTHLRRDFAETNPFFRSFATFWRNEPIFAAGSAGFRPKHHRTRNFIVEVKPVTRTSLAVLSILGLVLEGRSWNFETDPPGTIARGFVGVEGRWEVVETPAGRVLAQQASNPDKTFNVALVDGAEAQDVDLSVRVKPVAGVEDQGGGLVWRARDGRNYYIARYNPLEANFRVYKVVDGVRTLFQDAAVPQRAGWRTVRVVMVGDHAECFLDDTKWLDVHDGTFPGPGRVGVWSKADARSHFDDLRLDPPAPRSGR